MAFLNPEIVVNIPNSILDTENYDELEKTLFETHE